MAGGTMPAWSQPSSNLAFSLPLLTHVVVNHFSGPYDNPNSISACLRAREVGVIDVDCSPDYGGGEVADLTSNATFDFLLMLVHSSRVVGILYAQPCGSGSVLRFPDSDGERSAPAPVCTYAASASWHLSPVFVSGQGATWAELLS